MRNLGIDGTNQSTTNNFGIQVLNSTDVFIEGCTLLNMVSFGIFITASGSSTTSNVRVTNCLVRGRGNADVIGGGPNGATSFVTDIRISNNTIIQDNTAGFGTYSNAFDITGCTRVSFLNNHVQGSVTLGAEQYQHINCVISGNTVRPAIAAATNGGVYCLNSTTPTAASDGIVITNNTLILCELQVNGNATYKTKNVVVAGNAISTTNSQNGITLNYCTIASVTGNTVNGTTAAVYLTNCDNTYTGGNELANSLYGVRDITGVASNIIGLNSYTAISTANTVGGSPALPIAQGGTGSTTQNFVDLTTAQTVAGTKTFSSIPVASGLKPSADSVTGVQIQNSAGTNIVNVDTTNSRVGIGTTSPQYTLDTRGKLGLLSSGNGTYTDVMVIADPAFPTSYYHKVQSQVNGTASLAALIFSIASGASTWVDVLKMTGNGYAIFNAGNVGIGNTSPNSLLQVSGPIATAIATKTTTYTVAATDSVILGDATGTAFTITLPTAVGIAGRQYTIKRINSNANILTVASAGGTIDGGTTRTFSSQYQSESYVSDGTNWFVV
ncbi:MAG: hypothetical protein NVS1B10_01600 [Candidatus Saccharimonadales bacterium]